jgi:hypothetical protein
VSTFDSWKELPEREQSIMNFNRFECIFDLFHLPPKKDPTFPKEMERQRNAYVTPAAVILGIALHNLASSVYLLSQKARKASSNWIWKASLMAALVIFGFIVCQMIILDFITSSYIVPDYWLGLVQFLIYLFHLLATIAISTVLMLRLSVFYTAYSSLMVSMYFLLFLVIMSKTIGDGFGMILSLAVMRNEYLTYEQHPYFVISQTILGVGATADLLFSVLGSVGFLYALSAIGSNPTKKSFFRDVLFEHDGYRLIMICILHIFICSFALFVSFGRSHTFITRTGLYMPSWVYALELRTFLELSYVTAKEIIIKQGKTTSSAANGFSEKKSLDMKHIPKDFSRDFKQEPPRSSLDRVLKHTEYQTMLESSFDSKGESRQPKAQILGDGHREVQETDEMTFSTPSPSSESSYAYYDAVNDYASSASKSGKSVPQYF